MSTKEKTNWFRANLVKAVLIAVLAGIVTAAAVIAVKVVIPRAEKNRKVSRYLETADKYLQELDYENAIVAYETVIEIEPDNESAYIGIADSYIAADNYKKALEALEKGMEAIPGSGDIRGKWESVCTEWEQNNICGNLSGIIIEADNDTDYADNSVIEGAAVAIVKKSGVLPYESSGTTDRNGQYEFAGLYPGIYELSVRMNGYRDVNQTLEIYGEQEIFFNSAIEAVPEEWSGTGTATGRIYDALTGYGVEGLTLTVREGLNDGNGTVVDNITTDYDGYYATSELPAGNYSIYVSDNRQPENDETDWFDAEWFDSEDMASVNYGNLVIPIKILGGVNIGNQDGTVSTEIADGQMRVVLTWGATPDDLDSHMQCDLDVGKSDHVFYADMDYYYEKERIAGLDLDDTSCYGPETTTLYSAKPGLYTFTVHNFSRDSMDGLSESGATVQVYLGENTAPSYIFNVPIGKGMYWKVFTYDSNTGILTPINELYEDYLPEWGWDSGFGDRWEPEPGNPIIRPD